MSLRIWGVVIGVVVLSVGLGYFYFGKQKLTFVRQTEAPVDVVFALPRQPPTAPLFVAAAEAFFEKNGVQLAFKRFPSGARALEAMLAGEADMAVVADVPVAGAGLNRSDFKILASIARSDNEACIVARRDLGVSQPADLNGKKMGTQKLSAVHYFMDAFVNKQKLENVQKLYFQAEELVPALTSGRIDAFSMREPYLGEAKKQLGRNAVVFCEPNLYVRDEYLVVRDSFLQNNRVAAERVLKAIIDAEFFMHQNPERSILHTANELKAEVKGIEAVWRDLEFEISLSQSSLSQLEAEGLWAIRYLEENSKRTLPNYLSLIDSTVLSEIDSKRVTLIR